VVKRDAKGGAVVEVPGVSDEWATRFALSFGRDAEVLSPPSARRHYGDAVRRALARYR
jgi:predicted DNA-binding transcriptional regulator YafY